MVCTLLAQLEDCSCATQCRTPKATWHLIAELCHKVEFEYMKNTNTVLFVDMKKHGGPWVKVWKEIPVSAPGHQGNP